MPVRYTSLAVWLALGAAGLTHARCPAPEPPASIPSGATATHEEMTQAQRSLQAFNTAVGTYRQCVVGELTQEAIGRTPEEKRALQEETTRPYTELLTKLHWMSDCYNAELKTFQATGGGKKATPADCSSYVAGAVEASTLPAPPPPPPPTVPPPPTWEAAKALLAHPPPESPPPPSPELEAQGFSAPQTVAHGNWYYRTARSEQLQPCRYRGAPECVQVRLDVANRSTRILECRAQAELDGNNNEGVSHVDMPGVVLPGRTQPLLTTLLPAATTVISSTASCAEREPLAPLSAAPECRFQIARPVNVPDYYPPASRRVGEQGPVALQFLLPDKQGKATHIQVIGSSLFERLDAAAVKAAADILFTTSCPGTDFRVQLMFSLD